MTENEKYLYDHFLINVKSGFEPLEEIIDAAMETVEEEGWQREISEEWIEEILTREYKKNEQASQTWQAPTDPSKLVEVFNQLCRNNILALHNVGYTESEAVYDTQDVCEELEDNDIHPIGYCYYSGQGLERVITTGELPIGFSGMKEDNDKEAILVGNKVAAALKDAGFAVEWNHSAADKIVVTDFKWQNIFTSDEEVDSKWGHDRVFDLMLNSTTMD